MGIVGCYCGLRTRSNKVRWSVVVLFFIGGLLGLGMAIAELAKCNRPCKGDKERERNKIRLRGMPIYKCSNFTPQNKVYSCSRPLISERFWIGASFWVVTAATAASMLCCSEPPLLEEQHLSQRLSGAMPSLPDVHELATVHEGTHEGLHRERSSVDSIRVPVTTAPAAHSPLKLESSGSDAANHSAALHKNGSGAGLAKQASNGNAGQPETEADVTLQLPDEPPKDEPLDWQ